MHKEIKVFKTHWLSFGYGKRLSLGFSIDKYSINIDFLCFWVGIEL